MEPCRRLLSIVIARASQSISALIIFHHVPFGRKGDQVGVGREIVHDAVQNLLLTMKMVLTIQEKHLVEWRGKAP